MNRIRNLILFIFLVQSATAQVVQALKTEVDKEKILIGEPFTLTIEAVLPADKPVPWLTIDTLPHFEIISRSKIDSLLAGGKLRLIQKFTITSWDSGKWLLPSFYLPQPRSKKTAPIAIDVSYAPFNPQQDYNDVKDILAVPKPERTTWYWYVIGAVLLIFFLMLLFPVKKGGKEAVAVRQEGAYKKALAKLHELGAKTGMNAETFYTEVVHILRTYILDGKGIQSFQTTTGDLSTQLKKFNLPADNYNALVQTLQVSDVVKFARFNPPAAENRTTLEVIRNSIIAIENANP